MSSKRKDNKGRVLHNGEYQQSNGRYRYKYYDGTGKARYLYSWRLDKNDRMPDGKRQGKSLREQERKYLKFVKQDKHFSRYYEGIFILFNTGLRISEFVGLTTKNIDFKHHKIIVDHQLIRSSKMQYMIEETKTESGVREIPMSER